MYNDSDGMYIVCTAFFADFCHGNTVLCACYHYTVLLRAVYSTRQLKKKKRKKEEEEEKIFLYEKNRKCLKSN